MTLEATISFETSTAFTFHFAAILNFGALAFMSRTVSMLGEIHETTWVVLFSVAAMAEQVGNSEQSFLFARIT